MKQTLILASFLIAASGLFASNALNNFWIDQIDYASEAAQPLQGVDRYTLTAFADGTADNPTTETQGYTFRVDWSYLDNDGVEHAVDWSGYHTYLPKNTLNGDIWGWPSYTYLVIEEIRMFTGNYVIKLRGTCYIKDDTGAILTSTRTKTSNSWML